MQLKLAWTSSRGTLIQPNWALDNYLRISFRVETDIYLVIEISWELRYCCVSIMSFLEPSALLVWLLPTLGIYSWADVAAEEAAHWLYLFVFFIILLSLSWPLSWKKKQQTQPTSGELDSLWLSFPFLLRSLSMLPPCCALQAGVQPRARDSLWTSFVGHVAMCSLISITSQREIGVYLV